LLNIDTEYVIGKIKNELYGEFGDKVKLAVDKVPEIYSLIVRDRQNAMINKIR
jgi:hypothetical protein